MTNDRNEGTGRSKRGMVGTARDGGLVRCYPPVMLSLCFRHWTIGYSNLIRHSSFHSSFRIGRTEPKNMKMTPDLESFFEMSDKGKKYFVRRLERGIAPSRLKPLSREDRALWKAAKRGRPRKPASAKSIPVQVTFEPKLLKRIDAYTTAEGITRAELLARGAELAMGRRDNGPKLE